MANAGFSCLTPTKHSRCIDQCTLATTCGLPRDDLLANHSFIVHVHDIVNLLPGTMQGMWAPLKFHKIPARIAPVIAVAASARAFFKRVGRQGVG